MARRVYAIEVIRVSGHTAGRRGMTKEFARYIALGDSISIDLYPAEDVERRHRGKASTDKLGAASLLFQNDDKFWPEFRHRDLHSFYPALVFRQGGGWLARRGTDDLTADGATSRDLLQQVDRVPASGEATLVTITAGGNDLLGEIGFRGSPGDALYGNPVPPICDRLQQSVSRVLQVRPNSLVVIATVYDPSDGTNRLPGLGVPLDREAAWLRQLNASIRTLATTDRRLRLADIHRHFLGHGLTVKPGNRWYLEESIIEPNARGASEVRRVWLEAIGR